MDREISEILSESLNSGFVSTLLNEFQQAYNDAYEQLLEPAGGHIHRRNFDLDQIDLGTVLRGRGDSGKRALARAFSKCGLPFETKRLSCNGLRILVGQIGRVLIISQPIRFINQKPNSADYKRDLADSHFAIRQLEMDLGDGYRQRIESRDTVLAVLQHGCHGNEFNRRETALSMFQLAVPDIDFGSWLWKANAMNDELDYRLDWKQHTAASTPVQEDKVRVYVRAAIQKTEVI